MEDKKQLEGKKMERRRKKPGIPHFDIFVPIVGSIPNKQCLLDKYIYWLYSYWASIPVYPTNKGVGGKEWSHFHSRILPSPLASRRNQTWWNIISYTYSSYEQGSTTKGIVKSMRACRRSHLPCRFDILTVSGSIQETRPLNPKKEAEKDGLECVNTTLILC